MQITRTIALLSERISERSIITMLTVEARGVKLTFKTLASPQTLVRVVVTFTRKTCSSHGVLRTFTLASYYITNIVWSFTTTSCKQEKVQYFNILTQDKLLNFVA